MDALSTSLSSDVLYQASHSSPLTSMDALLIQPVLQQGLLHVDTLNTLLWFRNPKVSHRQTRMLSLCSELIPTMAPSVRTLSSTYLGWDMPHKAALPGE